jgi:hypothetical protein
MLGYITRNFTASTNLETIFLLLNWFDRIKDQEGDFIVTTLEKLK